jgi:hypothetical protein
MNNKKQDFLLHYIIATIISNYLAIFWVMSAVPVPDDLLPAAVVPFVLHHLRASIGVNVDALEDNDVELAAPIKRSRGKALTYTFAEEFDSSVAGLAMFCKDENIAKGRNVGRVTQTSFEEIRYYICKHRGCSFTWRLRLPKHVSKATAETSGLHLHIEENTNSVVINV